MIHLDQDVYIRDAYIRDACIFQSHQGHWHDVTHTPKMVDKRTKQNVTIMDGDSIFVGQLNARVPTFKGGNTNRLWKLFDKELESLMIIVMS
jgi:hypothetical protein